MSQVSILMRWVWLFMAAGLVTVGLTACGGSDGDDGLPGPPGPNVTSSAESLNISIESVTISSPPVVELSVSNEDGVPFNGINSGDLSFAIAKLVPGTNGDSSYWQSYINREETATVGPGTGNSAVQANRESDGTLVNNGDGTYTYTFATDITNVTAPLAVSYEPNLTHRVAIQVGGGLPVSNPIYTFRPSDGATSGIFTRDIVKIENCNECHNKLALHGGGRVDTKYCVTCHNPGSTDANSGNTVDFKVMIHKIHRGEDLPSVDAGGEYSIYGFRDNKHDYSDVALPQDIRNCTKCHDGTDPDTPDGDNWKTQVSIQACGSCHDDVDFSKDGSDEGANDPDGHEGGIMTDNSECLTCHATNRVAGSVAERHVIPGRAEAENYQFNIVDVTGGTTPVIQLSVTDPNSGTPYDITAGDATTNPVFRSSDARLSIMVAWSVFDSGANVDYNNAGSGGSDPITPAQPVSVNPVEACEDGISDDGDWVCTEASGVYTLTKQTPLPAGATGTGRVGFEGHPGLPQGGRMTIKSVVKDFAITDPTPVARREVVDIDKCNMCHDQLSLHGGNRTDEPQLCVMCHNPSLTDISYSRSFSGGPYDGTPARPKAVDGAGDILYPLASPLDGKTEESADFKRLIHGIHAAAETNFDGSEAHGFREQGIQVRRDDFSHVRFPGILQDCETCHLPDTYVLEDAWETPTLNGIQATSIRTTPLVDNTNLDPAVYAAALVDQNDDLRISPTAAACSACHASAIAMEHMKVPGGAVFDETQGNITGMVDGNFETCAVCHGPGRDADVEVVHAAR